MTTSPHTVGLLGPNGRVGSAVLEAILPAVEQGKVKLVVFHRPGSPPKAKLPSSVDVREIDLEGDVAKIEQAVKGVNVMVSLLAAQALGHQTALVEGLAKSQDIVTWVPAKYGHPFGADHFDGNQFLEGMSQMMEASSARAKELGVGTTVMSSGVFDEYFFSYSFLGFDVKNNTIQVNDAQRKNGVPITSMPYLGQGIAELLLRPPETIKNQSYSFIEFWPTGNDLIKLLKTLNGSEPTVKDYTKEDVTGVMAQPPFGPVSVGYRARWAEGKWGYKGETTPKGWKARTLEQDARQWV